MRYIHAIQGAIISVIIFAAAVVFIPGVGPSGEVETTLTVSTFLFAILAGFFISRVNTRYNDIRELVAEEDATILSIYKTAQMIGKGFSDRIRDLIDKYYIIAYDFELKNYPYKLNEKYLLRMWDELKKSRKRGVACDKMIESLKTLENNRNRSVTISNEKVGYGHWAILIFLSGIILFSMFYMKTPEFYSQVITVLLSTVLVLVLLIMRDLHNLKLGGQELLAESGQEVLEFIGKKRYYRQEYLDSGIYRLPKEVKEYRIGSHEPGSEKFKIKVVKK